MEKGRFTDTTGSCERNEFPWFYDPIDGWLCSSFVGVIEFDIVELDGELLGKDEFIWILLLELCEFGWFFENVVGWELGLIFWVFVELVESGFKVFYFGWYFGVVDGKITDWSDSHADVQSVSGGFEEAEGGVVEGDESCSAYWDEEEKGETHALHQSDG